MKTFISLFAAAALLVAGESKLGKPLTMKESISVADLNAKAVSLNGKTVQVKGKITEVCEMMGCWMNLVDPASNAKIKIKVNDGEIVFPKTAIGKMAVAEGKLTKVEMTKEKAIEHMKHEAEEKGKKFDPKSVTGPMSYWQIQGTGAVILE